MSTKIYTGFRFKQRDIGVITRQVRAFFQKVIAPLQEQHMAQFHAISFAGRMDALALKGELASKSPTDVLYDVFENWMERQAKIKSTQRRDPAVDLGYEMVCYTHPVEDHVGYAVIGYVISEFGRDASQKLLIEAGMAEDYSFWDNTDPNEAVSKADWNERRHAWDAALDPETGGAHFVFSAPDTTGFPSRSALTPYFPSFEKRVRDCAVNQMLKKHEEAQKSKDGETQLQSLGNRLLEIDQAIKAQAGPDYDEYQRLVAEISPLLVQDLGALLPA